MKVLRRRRTKERWTRPRGRVDGRALWWYYVGRWGRFQICATPRHGATIAAVEYEGEVIVWPRAPNLAPWEKVMKKRKASAEAATVKHLAAVESELLAKHMSIVNHCAVTQYDDGDPRKPGWITVKTLGSAWQIEAKDPDTCCRLTVIQANLDDALGLMNLLLESEEAPWEPDPWLAQQAAKNRKKA